MKYQVTFLSTGRTFTADLQFGAGVTAITGENESGKSLILEMIRYALFGSGALRSVSGNYRNLSVTLVFGLGDDEYRVDRRARLETLQKNGEVVASGTSTLNDLIPRTLGFNLRVFDVACSANQGDIEKLTNMRPADRKQMVDSVIGLNVLDGIEKWTREEAVRMRREADALSEGLVRPVAPTPPPGINIRPAAELGPELQAADADYRRWIGLQAIQQPSAPLPPIDPKIEATAEQLQAHQQERAAAMAEVARLQRLVASIPDATHTAEQLDAAEAWNGFVAEVKRRGTRPTLTLAEIEAAEAMWEARDAWRPSEPCDSCGYRATDAVQPPAPEHTKAALRAERTALAQWAEPMELVPLAVPELTASQITAGRRAIELQDQKRAATQALLGLIVPEDRTQELQNLQRFQTAQAVYQSHVDRYNEQLAAWQQAQAQLSTLEGAPERFALLNQQHTALSVYEAQLQTHLVAEVSYDAAMDRVTEKQRTADGMRKGSDALRLTRTKVKQHLIPSLSRVASGYLTSMTGGRRTQVVIDDDFNIVVDGQEIDELAGSAKAVVNLSVRLGLGQVLTQRVFPVFLGDEIDAAMDSTRAEATTETLRGLTERIKQVIIVSHKQVEADHQISL
jgi:exonuclease SbcC